MAASGIEIDFSSSGSLVEKVMNKVPVQVRPPAVSLSSTGNSLAWARLTPLNSNMPVIDLT